MRKLVGRILLKLIPNDLFDNKIIDVYEKKWAKLSRKFRYMGERADVKGIFILRGEKYISIGNGFKALYNLRMEAYDEYYEQRFSPEIIVGNNVIFNSDCHIGCIKKVVIGDNVLVASRVYISDHYHGEITRESLAASPAQRPLVSKGPVIIEDNVWIGEGVCVLSGVTIGRNAIIGANSVVNKDVPPNSVVAGVPAKLIKTL